MKAVGRGVVGRVDTGKTARGTKEEAAAAVKAREDGGLDWGGEDGDVEKRRGSGLPNSW